MSTRRTTFIAAGVAAATALLMSIAGTALASHVFSDVPDGSFFESSIQELTAAGCATGYPDGTFRPNANPTRAQFAYWMTNCGGRVNWSRQAFTQLDRGETQDLEVLDINPPAAGGESGPAEADLAAVGYLEIHAAVNIAHDSVGLNCPCRVTIQLLYDGSPISDARSITLADDPAENGFVDAHGAIAHGLTFDSAGDNTIIGVRVINADGNTDNIVGNVEMTVSYHPFVLGT